MSGAWGTDDDGVSGSAGGTARLCKHGWLAMTDDTNARGGWERRCGRDASEVEGRLLCTNTDQRLSKTPKKGLTRFNLRAPRQLLDDVVSVTSSTSDLLTLCCPRYTL